MSDKLKIMQERIVIDAVLVEELTEDEIFALDAVLFGSLERHAYEELDLLVIDRDFIEQYLTGETLVEPFFATPWGIDISHHNGRIDWARAAEAGVGFAFMKATEGASFVDSTFKRNFAEAKANGILAGAYHFFQPKVSVERQVENFCKTFGAAKNGDLPPVLDVEDGSLWTGISKKKATDLVIAWIDGVRAKLGSHVNPIVYASSSFVGDVLGSDVRLRNHPLWVAHYTSASSPRVPKPWSFWTFWQYTERGRVAGISGNVDINRFNGDRGRLEAMLMRK